MSELTSAEATRQATAQHNDDPFLVLLTLDHETLTAPIRIVRNRQDVISRGDTYIAYPFTITLAGDTEEAPSARVTVSNVARSIGKALEQLITPPSATIEIVLASTPDTVERTWSNFQLLDVSWDAFRITGTLGVQEYWNEPWPKIRVTPTRFPGLFP